MFLLRSLKRQQRAKSAPVDDDCYVDPSTPAVCSHQPRHAGFIAKRGESISGNSVHCGVPEVTGKQCALLKKHFKLVDSFLWLG